MSTHRQMSSSMWHAVPKNRLRFGTETFPPHFTLGIYLIAVWIVEAVIHCQNRFCMKWDARCIILSNQIYIQFAWFDSWRFVFFSFFHLLWNQTDSSTILYAESCWIDHFGSYADFPLRLSSFIFLSQTNQKQSIRSTRGYPELIAIMNRRDAITI